METKKNESEVLGILSKETLDILSSNKLPNCPILEYNFDDKIKVEDNKIILGKQNSQDLYIDLNNNEAIYLSTPTRALFLNSSLDSFIKYIEIFNIFIQKLRDDRKHKTEYVKEWEDAMIKIDEKAFNDKGYYWGAYAEDYENGMLM